MRNLKKVLALVLVFAMAFTMVSFAALEDVAGSDYENQIKTNVALGIIKGKDNGDFDPTGNVTRAEMAKMIYVLLKGKDDGAVIYKGASDLKDVKGHWAEGYINYCYSLDIIAGRGNGLFDPNANVTAAEASKMLLVALGWDANKEGLVGASWAIKAVARAEKEDILDNFAEDGDIMAPLNREGAANLVYNALFADTIAYVAWGSDAGAIVRGDTLAEDVFELIEADAFLTATEAVGLGEASPEGTTTYTTVDGEDEIVVADTKADFNNLGRLFTIYYKEDASRADTDKGANATLFTAIYSDDNKVVATSANNFSLDRDDMFTVGAGVNSAKFFIQASDNSYHFLGTNWNTRTFINGVALGTVGSIRYPAYRSGYPVYLLTDADKSAPKKISGAGKYSSYVGYEYTDAKYNYVVTFVPTFMEVTAKSTKTVTFKDNFAKTSVTADVDDIIYKGIDGVSKGDYVLVFNMNGGNKYVVTECPTVSGKVIGFDEGNKIILDSGAVMATQGNATSGSSLDRRQIGIPGTMYADNNAMGSAVAPLIGQTVKLYTDGKYVLYAEDTAVANDKYLVAMAGTIGAEKANRAGTKFNLFVTALFADGTEKEIQVSKVGGTEVADKTSQSAAEALLAADSAYSYKLVDGLYELTAVSGTSTFDDETFANYYKNTGAFKNGVNYYYITEDTTVFVKEEGEDVVAVKAADLKEDFATSASIVVDYIAGDLDGRVANLKFVYITADESITTATSEYKFARALSDGQFLYDSTEKKYYGTIKLFVDGEVATFVSDAVFSSKKSIPNDRSFMIVALDGDKLAALEGNTGLDYTSFKTDLSASGYPASGLAVLNTAYGLELGDDDYNKLYAVTTSATELRGNLLFTKYVFNDGSYANDEFFIDKDTEIFGVNSASGAAAANEIVVRGDDVRNVTVIFNYDTRAARYILVDTGASFGKETR